MDMGLVVMEMGMVTAMVMVMVMVENMAAVIIWKRKWGSGLFLKNFSVDNKAENYTYKVFNSVLNVTEASGALCAFNINFFKN